MMHTESEIIPIFPTLYKNKSGKNKITKWTVKIEHNVQDSTPNNNTYNIIVTFGEIDGKQQVHTTSIEKGKAGRSVFKQTLLEANSKWNEKKNRDGYCILAEKGDNDADSTLTPTPTTSTSTIVKFNNDNNIKMQIRPMLANTFNCNNQTTTRGYKMPFPAFVQKKYDGIRCVAHSSSSGDVTLESRKGLSFPHFEKIINELQLFFTHANDLLQTDCENNDRTHIHFDGELYCDNIPFEKINGYTRLTKNISDEDRENINKIQYHIYDCYVSNIPTLSFRERMDLLRRTFAKIKDSKTSEQSDNQYVYEVETELVKTIEEMKLKHNQYVENGYEGIMIRDPFGPYEPNKRSKFLQKYKEFMDEEFVITGFHDGEGIDKCAVIWDCVTKEGKHFSVKPKSNFEERKALYKIASTKIGCLLTVVFQEYSPDGIPRFPVGKGIRDVDC